MAPLKTATCRSRTKSHFPGCPWQFSWCTTVRWLPGVGNTILSQSVPGRDSCFALRKVELWGRRHPHRHQLCLHSSGSAWGFAERSKETSRRLDVHKESVDLFVDVCMIFISIVHTWIDSTCEYTWCIVMLWCYGCALALGLWGWLPEPQAGSPVTTLLVCPSVEEWRDFENFDAFREEILLMLGGIFLWNLLNQVEVVRCKRPWFAACTLAVHARP